MNEPKHFACTSCGHLFNKPRVERAVLSDFTTLKAHVCPKCRKFKTVRENPEWVQWLHAERDRQVRDAWEHNGGYLLGRKLPDETRPIGEPKIL